MARTAVRKRKPRVEVYESNGSLRHYVLKLSPKDQYALLSAVRGPDVQSSAVLQILKNRVTERLRDIVFVDECPGSIRGDAMDLGIANYVVKLVREHLQEEGVGHYASHLRLAIRATREHRIWGGHADLLITGLLLAGAV